MAEHLFSLWEGPGSISASTITHSKEILFKDLLLHGLSLSALPQWQSISRQVLVRMNSGANYQEGDT